jgi:hypothetical protein
VPEEVKVTDWVDGVFISTSPKAMLEALTVSVGVPVPSCKAKVSATLPALAVRVAVCAVLTDETVAANLALLAPAATVTEAGTVTALLLLERLTLNPPLGAAALNATVQESVPAPAIDPLAQLNADRLAVVAGTAAPRCRAKVSATLPALAVRVAVCAVLTDETVAVKLAVVEPAATVTDVGTVTALSLLERLTVRPLLGAAAFNATVQESVPAPVIDPLAQLNADRLTVAAGAGAPSCRAKVSETPLALAVRVAVCAVLTEETVAVKPAVVEPAATVTVAGTVTALSLLERLTLKPPLGAAAFSATVQESVPAPEIDPLAQLNEDRLAVDALGDVPVPLDPSDPEFAVLTISLLPVQPDRANGRQHETRRNTCQRRDGTIRARKCASHRSVWD